MATGKRIASAGSSPGFDNGAPLRLSSGESAIPIWGEYMRSIPHLRDEPKPPPGNSEVGGGNSERVDGNRRRVGWLVSRWPQDQVTGGCTVPQSVRNVVAEWPALVESSQHRSPVFRVSAVRCQDRFASWQARYRTTARRDACARHCFFRRPDRQREGLPCLSSPPASCRLRRQPWLRIRTPLQRGHGSRAAPWDVNAYRRHRRPALPAAGTRSSSRYH